MEELYSKSSVTLGYSNFILARTYTLVRLHDESIRKRTTTNCISSFTIIVVAVLGNMQIGF